AAVGDGPALVAAVVEHRPDIAIVDVRLPPSQRDEGLRAALEARRQVPGTPVLVLSQYVEESYAAELLAENVDPARPAVGYLLKDRVADPSDFVEAVTRVADGGTAMDPEVVGQLLARRRKDDPLEELTPRERDVLDLMAQGLSNAAIAGALVVSEGAVEKHVSSIFAKLGLHTVPGANLRVHAVLTWLRRDGGPG
ncbi:MAG: response regulator transcription factor, partial [Solirubrobacterales bacterium]|nr:response regulator transcription factor [Solirubrobacterales bacterium]